MVWIVWASRRWARCSDQDNLCDFGERKYMKTANCDTDAKSKTKLGALTFCTYTRGGGGGGEECVQIGISGR